MKKKTPTKKSSAQKVPQKRGPKFKLNDKIVSAENLAMLASKGCTTKDLSDIFGISINTFNAFLQKHPEILTSLKNDKEKCDNQVEASLYVQALGYEIKETKVFYNSTLDKVVKEDIIVHVKPNVVATIFWLKNRQPEKWRELQEFAGKFQTEHSGKIEVEEVTDDTRERALRNMSIVQRFGNLSPVAGQN